MVHKIEAVHLGSHSQQKRAKQCDSKVFEGLRDTVHLVRGCKVMLTRNVNYAKGLANGTRGKVVGIVYGPGGLGTFPEAIVVDFPDYDGEKHGKFYDDEPTWVPILPMTSVKEGTRLMRTQFPLAAAFALTVNKAQGLTLKEGVVIHLVGGSRFRPASKHGLPFVAWTRSESFAMTAFKNLPPWSDFEKGQESDMLRMRNAYIDKLWHYHEKTLNEHSDMATTADEPERVACDVVAASAENTKPNGLLEKAPQLDDWDMQVNVAKTKVDFLVANRDWVGAAVAQEEVEKLEALAKEMRAKNTMKYEPDDFAQCSLRVRSLQRSFRRPLNADT